ncbi:BadF/BadG/BcrA/BcrD ATPase family protein [Microvirga flavescens]|uniref:BadF/BadG/BcrA/BcrD ATPase family protein n=1 Tax=Microvirga flavescens TaxID=2249811 RepID=UPI000DDB13EF|nr:BadF/BadG/BcrA/BcrD ATPase family protein [Microvirga flavescens]
MSEFLFIGIDGGGTSCRARLRDGQGNLLGEGSGGSANIRLDPDLVWSSILTACRAALSAAGLGEDAFTRTRVGFGMAGAGQKSAVDRLLSRPHPFAAVAIDTDAHTAWLGAFGGKDGAIIIVGTGSCGYGVARGKRFQIGGWGFEISDEGSGAVMGREALRRALWVHDGLSPASSLATEILADFGNSPQVMVDWVGQSRPSDYARYAPIVLKHAAERDSLATALVEHAAGGIARIADRLLDLGAPSLCLFGGLGEPLRHWLPPSVQDTIVPPLSDALDGAILLARQAEPQVEPKAERM